MTLWSYNNSCVFANITMIDSDIKVEVFEIEVFHSKTFYEKNVYLYLPEIFFF